MAPSVQSQTATPEQPAPAATTNSQTAPPAAGSGADTAPEEQTPAEDPGGPARMPDLAHHPLELAYLPPKAELILSVRVAELWQAPLVQKVLTTLGPMGQMPVEQLTAKFGIGLNDIESITVGVTGMEAMIAQGMALAQTVQAGGAEPDADAPGELEAPESNTVIVLRTYEELEQEAILAAMPHGEPVPFGGSSYYPLEETGAGSPMFLHFADTKVMVLGGESEVQRAIRSGKRPARVPRTLQPFNANYHFVLVAPASSGSKWLESAVESAPPLADLGFTPEMVRKLAAVGLSIDAERRLVAELRVECRNQSAAGEISEAFGQAVAQMHASVPQGASPDTEPPGGLAEEIMSSLSTGQNGNAVTMTIAVPSSAFEAENLGMAMAPLMMMSGGGLEGGGPLAADFPTGLNPKTEESALVEPEAEVAALDDEPIVAREPRDGPPRILVDATKGPAAWWRPQPGPEFDPELPHRGSEVVEYFEQQGWPVRELGEDDDVIAALDEADIAIRIGDTSPHTPAEVRAYNRFVRSGGSLLLLAKDRPDDREDPLAKAFGIRFAGQITSGSISDWDDENPVTRRLGSISFVFASEVAELPESATVWGQSEDQDGATPLVGMLERDHGTVVFFSSESFLVNLPQPLTERVFALLKGDLKLEESPRGNAVLTAARIERDFEPKADLNQSAWAAATPVNIERESESEEVNSELATTVRVLWSDEYLYLGFEAPFEELAAVERPNTQREQRELESKDVVEVLISGSSRRVSDFHEFQLTPRGEWADVKITDSGDETDTYWDSGFEKVSQVDEQKKVWTAVMRIPLDQVSIVTPKAGSRWRVNFFRNDQASGTLLAWNPTRSDDRYVGRRFGTLVFEE